MAKRFNHRIYFDFFANTQGVHKSRLFSKLATSNIKDLICYILIRRKFHFYIFSSRYSSDGRYRINHPDYEVYQKVAKDSTDNNLSNYVVYVDNFFPFHPDILNRDSHVDPIRLAPLFYSSLNAFFSKVERHYGCKVVIAAHPSSVYTNNPFDDRDIIYNKTCELIKNCTAVCMHTSNALSYAILFNKPLALLTNKAFQQAQLEFMRLENISSMLSMKLINTDMYLSDIKSGTPKANYIYKNMSLYIDRSIELSENNEDILRECICKVQEVRNKKNRIHKLGLCRFNESKIAGVAFNEAGIQYILSTLLDKKSRRVKNIVPNYIGFEIENKFVVGYGLDYKDCFRNLPFIGYVDI